jgi:beclin 1
MAASTKAGLKDNPAMSFVMLTDSQVVQPQNTSDDHQEARSKEGSKQAFDTNYDTASDPRQPHSHQLESTARLFEILSSRSDVDHPICVECTELLLSQLQSRLAATTKERDAYITFLKTLNNTTPTQAEISKAQSSLAASKAAEANAFAELLALEEERAALDDEVATLEAESLALDDEEQAFWRSRNAFALTLNSLQNERDAVNAAYDHDAQQLERLQRSNVYNDVFCIGHDGSFATINGLRLGRLPPPQNVDWPEINAAWGTAALLLATVADKLRFTFRGYKIRPMGSTSKIEKIEYPPSASRQLPSGNAPLDSTTQQRQQQPKVTPLDLFSSGDLPLGRMLLHRRLDAGMVAFLECLRQLGEFVEASSANGPAPHPTSPAQPSPKPTGRESPASGTHGLKLPYAIRKDKIGDSSIKLGVSQDEAWTRACKFTLTCCKFLLAHASNVGGEERRRQS